MEAVPNKVLSKSAKRKAKLIKSLVSKNLIPSSYLAISSSVKSISVPAAKSSIVRQSPFKSFRFQHREMVNSSVVGTSTFATSSLIINPGLSLSFPYLSILATAFDQYTFHKLQFEFVQRCPSSTAGNVDLFPDYNSNDTAPSNEMQASSFQDYVSSACWNDVVCDLDVLAMFPEGHKRKYVRGFQTLSANEDPKTYDAGIMYVATNGNASSTSFGQLFAYYDVEFFVPTLEEGSLSLSQHVISATAPTTAANFGATRTQNAGSNNLVSIAGNVLTFNYGGLFLIVLFTHTSTSCTVTAAPAVAAGGELVTTFYETGPGYSYSTSPAADQTTTVVMTAVSGSTLTFDNTLVNGVASDLLIVSLPPFQT